MCQLIDDAHPMPLALLLPVVRAGQMLVKEHGAHHPLGIGKTPVIWEGPVWTEGAGPGDSLSSEKKEILWEEVRKENSLDPVDCVGGRVQGKKDLLCGTFIEQLRGGPTFARNCLI
jgi:hypothetical protein